MNKALDLRANFFHLRVVVDVEIVAKSELIIGVPGLKVSFEHSASKQTLLG